MSCYLKHIKDIMKEAGVEVTDKNKREIDQALHKIVRIKYRDCPHAWREVKKRINDTKERKAFVKEIKKIVK